MNARKAESRAYFRALGKHITELRKEIGMTQAPLARALKVSQQTVFAYELGDRRVSVLMLVKLARIFDTSVEELSGLKMPIRPKRRLSPAGVRHAECYQKLSKTEQRFIKKLMEILLERGRATIGRFHLIGISSVTTAPVLAAGVFFNQSGAAGVSWRPNRLTSGRQPSGSTLGSRTEFTGAEYAGNGNRLVNIDKR